jgi:hypothetical protein
MKNQIFGLLGVLLNDYDFSWNLLNLGPWFVGPAYDGLQIKVWMVGILFFSKIGMASSEIAKYEYLSDWISFSLTREREKSMDLEIVPLTCKSRSQILHLYMEKKKTKRHDEYLW